MSRNKQDENLNSGPDDLDDNNQKYQETKRPFPYEIKNVDHELNLQLLKDFTGEQTGFIQIGPQKWFFPSSFADQMDNFYNFKFRKDDVILLGYPRSGTTLMQEMLWLLCNDMDYKKASEIIQLQRFPLLEYSCYMTKVAEKDLSENATDPEKDPLREDIDTPSWKKLEECTDRRFIKTHLSLSLLTPDLTKIGCKIIYIARNAKNVGISNYHVSRLMVRAGFTGDFRTFWNYFQKNLSTVYARNTLGANGLILTRYDSNDNCVLKHIDFLFSLLGTWAPYFEHIKEGWSKRDEGNVLFIFYEDLIKNLQSTIEKVANFLGKSYSTEEIEKLTNHLKFENFKNNTSVNLEPVRDMGYLRKNEQGFIRKGKTGGWEDYFDEEMEKSANEWIENNLKDTDLKFPI